MRLFPERINNLLITWFGLGRLPVAPGTYGSLGAIPLCYFMQLESSFFLRICFCIGVTAIAILASAQDQARPNAPRDPGYIVVDEVAGMLWSSLTISLLPLPHLIAVFVLFRILDVVKPYPANHLDRKSKTASTPMGRGLFIVMDDVVSGIYTALISYFLFTKIWP